jgi:hypothetical protein
MCSFYTMMSLGQQKDFDYRKERHKFNISIISDLLKNKEKIRKIKKDEEFDGKYLGKVIAKDRRCFYVVISSYVFDIANLAKTENHIFLYNKKKQFIGYFYLSEMFELPQKLVGNKLYFQIDDCKKDIIINFSKGIPRAINLGCNGQNNYYEFKSE